MPMSREDITVIKPFNPLDKRHLGESVAEAVLSTDVHKLPPAPFIGAGVYVLYYTGPFLAYNELSMANQDGQYKRPIYVGKAVPAGARKGGLGLDVDPGLALQKRLVEHGDSIAAAENLTLDDFYCRFLVVDDIWIPLAESLLIEKFQPVWNRILDGFGNHDPGSGRYNQQKSPWDCLHPGRSWANRLPPCPQTEKQLTDRVVQYLASIVK